MHFNRSHTDGEVYRVPPALRRNVVGRAVARQAGRDTPVVWFGGRTVVVKPSMLGFF